jgi:hypothetical protein
MKQLVIVVTVLVAMTGLTQRQHDAKAKPKAAPPSPIFIFHPDEFWLNLHHFLYVLGRAENKEPNASRAAVVKAPGDQEQGFARLSPKEKALWREAVSAYAATLSKKDLIFDDPLPAVTNALARAGDARSPKFAGIDPSIASILERAAPIYRRVWWPNHSDANHNWQTEIQSLVDRHGATILRVITDAYQLRWPASGYNVHLSAYTNWAGAYSTRDNLLVVSSLDQAIHGAYGLETVFHEGMHQWDDQILRALREQGNKVGKVVPRDLSHALIFFTAGEAVRRVFPDHVPYAEQFGVWQRGMGPLKTIIEEVWKPYLNGHGTRDEAFAEIMRRTIAAPRSK